MKKIIYLDQNQLLHTDYSTIENKLPNYNWHAIRRVHYFDLGIQGIYPRFGKNNFPFIDQFSEIFGWQTPEYDSNFDLDFDTITNQRCMDLMKSYNNLPWLVLWSGGIDSTVILSSILKNLEKSDLEKIVVGCNAASVFENPEFFYNHIKPNFKLINSTNLTLDKEVLSSYYVIEGEPADQLFSGGVAQSMSFVDPDSLQKDFVKDPDPLIKYIAKRSQSPEFATWYYEHLVDNIKSVDIPIKTYHDFFWWHMFNMTWTPIKMRSLEFQTDTDVESLKLYLSNLIPWYDDNNYQKWAMCNNKFGIKYGSTISQYKLASKQYIYEFDKNKYYYDFKLKINSGARRNTAKSWCCILDDFSRLSIEHDLEQILNLLPGHMN